MELENIHIGNEIISFMNLHGITQAELARRLGIHKQSLTGLFDRETIDTGRLARISEALGFNFFELYKTAEPTNEEAPPSTVPVHRYLEGLDKQLELARESIRLIKDSL